MAHAGFDGRTNPPKRRVERPVHFFVGDYLNRSNNVSAAPPLSATSIALHLQRIHVIGYGRSGVSTKSRRNHVAVDLDRTPIEVVIGTVHVRLRRRRRDVGDPVQIIESEVEDRTVPLSAPERIAVGVVADVLVVNRRTARAGRVRIVARAPV